MKHIGVAIRTVRQAMDMQQQDLAEKAGVSSAHISAIELGVRDPSWTVVQRIADAMGINIAMLAMLYKSTSAEIKPFAPVVYGYILERSQKQGETA